MPNDQHKNQKEDTSAASVQSAREEDGCLVPSSLPCETESSILPVVNDQPAFENSVQKGGDYGATWSQDNRAPSPPAPALVSDSEYETADDNVSHDTPSGSSNEDGSGGPMCRICHEGDQEEPLVSLCSCSGTMGFVHVPCLEQWINQEKVDFCELCGQRFPLAALPSKVLIFFHWISQGDGRLQRMLLCELLMLVMLKIFMLAMFLLLHTALPVEPQQENSDRAFYLGSIVSFISCISLCIYRLMYRRLFDLYKLFRSWQSTHLVRRIATVPSAIEVPLG